MHQSYRLGKEGTWQNVTELLHSAHDITLPEEIEYDNGKNKKQLGFMDVSTPRILMYTCSRSIYFLV